ncbi:hypothetical protein TNCV_4868121 [Trichonephila clavipes]|nr:hypothetical protein TNCV_4868121 [Trichonephila clavipes]
MPDATKYPPSTHGVRARKSVDPVVLWAESRVQGTGVLLAPCHDEFPGSRSDYVRQAAFATTTTAYLVTGSSRFLLKTPLGFFGAEKGKFFPNQIQKRSVNMQNRNLLNSRSLTHFKMMTTPGSSFTPTPLGHEDNLEVRYHPRANTLHFLGGFDY